MPVPICADCQKPADEFYRWGPSLLVCGACAPKHARPLFAKPLTVAEATAHYLDVEARAKAFAPEHEEMLRRMREENLKHAEEIAARFGAPRRVVR